MKRLSDEELETLSKTAKKWGEGDIAPDYQQHLIQIELSLRILDKLNEKPEERKLVLC